MNPFFAKLFELFLEFLTRILKRDPKDVSVAEMGGIMRTKKFRDWASRKT